MTNKQRRWTSIILTLSITGGVGIRFMIQKTPPSLPSSTVQQHYGTAQPLPPVLTVTHPSIPESYITINNEAHLITINQRVALTDRKPGLHHGQGNAPSLPLIAQDYGITLKHLEDWIYSFDKDSGLMIWTNGSSFIYYDPNVSSIFAARFDFETIKDAPPLTPDGNLAFNHKKPNTK